MTSTAFPMGASASLCPLPRGLPLGRLEHAPLHGEGAHYVDIDFRAVPRSKDLFGPRGHAIFFFANYMNDVAEVPIRFRGANGPGEEESWIAADAPPGHPDWNGGGTYRHADAAPLEYDATTTSS